MQASFSWAWVLDERPEERARGVTVDVATTRFDTPKFAVSQGRSMRARPSSILLSSKCGTTPMLEGVLPKKNVVRPWPGLSRLLRETPLPNIAWPLSPNFWHPPMTLPASLACARSAGRPLVQARRPPSLGPSPPLPNQKIPIIVGEIKDNSFELNQ